MTFGFYLHIGYLVAYDARGIALAWSPRTLVKEGESRYRHALMFVFPWWMQPGQIRVWLYMRRLRRRMESKK